MGKKKKKTSIQSTVTSSNTVVKLTYIQTLAIANQLASLDVLESDSDQQDLGGSSSKKDNLPVIDVFNVFGSKKTSVSSEYETTGQKIKDQWLQPEFDRIRYALGIRELTASAYTFAPKSELISVPFLSPKEIVKVHVVVDQYIPPQLDPNSTWIEFYIKPEGDIKWTRVNPLNNPTKFDINGEIIPKIINFNIPKPTTAQLEDKYNTTDEPVRQFRFRAVFKRANGGNNESITPLLKSYRMIMSPRA